ncbi:MAG: hypothetical protein ACYTEZ_08930 [Planctomycetota bacterium]|jgi:hypothetical protein
MIRLLWIPVAGTVAALIVILLAHEPRGEEPGPAPVEAPPPVTEPPDETEPPEPDEAEPPPPPPPPPEAVEYQLRLEKDGRLVDIESGRTYADLADVLGQLVADERVRNRIFLSNGAEVTEEALDRAVETLRDSFEVRKVYSAPAKEE